MMDEWAFYGEGKVCPKMAHSRREPSGEERVRLLGYYGHRRRADEGRAKLFAHFICEHCNQWRDRGQMK
jgi:hypothetical protein